MFAVATVLAVGLIAAPPAAAAGSTFYTQNNLSATATNWCDAISHIGGQVTFGGAAASTQYSYNAPSSDQTPVYYSTVMAHSENECTAGVWSLRVTIWGFYPDGVAIPYSRIHIFGVWDSPHATGDSGWNILLAYVKAVLGAVPIPYPYNINSIPVGVINMVQTATNVNPPLMGWDAKTNSVWANWYTAYDGYPGTLDKALLVGWQIMVDPGYMVSGRAGGGYQMYVKYQAEFHQNNLCGRSPCYQGTYITLQEAMPLYCYLDCNPPQTNNAQFVSQSVPTSMSMGTRYTVSVTMKNTGTTTWFPYDRGTSYVPQWDANTKAVYRLGSQNPQDNSIWGLNRVDLAPYTPVLPGQTYTFGFVITAPSTAGYYNFQWRMVQENVEWFGAYSANIQVGLGGALTRVTNTLAPSTTPAIAVDGSGNYHLAWVENGKEIHYAKVGAMGNIIVADTRLTSSSGTAAAPSIAVASTGTIVVLWSDNRGGNFEIYSKSYTTRWGADTKKTTTTGDAKDPDLFIGSNGYVNFVYRTVCRPLAGVRTCNNQEQERVMYGKDTGGKNGLTVTQIFQYNGAVLSQTHNDRVSGPKIALGSGGQMHVAFSQGPAYQVEFTPTLIEYVRYSGTAWANAVQVGGSQDTVRRTVIEADSGNMVYVAWETWYNGFDIYLTKSANGGVSWPAWPTNTFGSDLASYQYAPDLAIGANQVVYLSWADNRDGQYEIYYASSNNLGGTWTGAARLTNAAGDSLYARMATLPSASRVGFAWQDYRNSVNNDGNWEVYFAS